MDNVDTVSHGMATGLGLTQVSVIEEACVVISVDATRRPQASTTLAEEASVVVDGSPIIKLECPTLEEEQNEEAVAAMEFADDLPITKYPSWVLPRNVNQIKKLKCFETVREMILTGMPAIEVGRNIQSLGELKRVKLDTIRQYVEHYKQTIPPWIMAAKQQPKNYLEVQKKTENGIDVLKKLAFLYETMEERITLAMKNDRKFGFLTPHLERSFTVAADLLMKIQETREKMGVAPGQERLSLPAGTSASVDWKRIYARESVSKVMADPDSRARVVRVAERLIDLYGQRLSEDQIDQLKKAKELGVEPEVLEPEEMGQELHQEPITEIEGEFELTVHEPPTEAAAS